MLKKFLYCLFPFALLAYEGTTPSPDSNGPWLTGPIVTTSGNITPKGHWNIEPYVYAFATTSFYKNDWSKESEDPLWTLQYRVPTHVGLSEWVDLKFMPIWQWKHRKNTSAWSLGDLSVQIEFQLYLAQVPQVNWLPSIRLSIRETLPTGKYRNLTPQKLGTDGGGNGTWRTSCHLDISKMLSFANNRFLNILFNFHYGIGTPVHIKGLNVYGGGFGTNGTIYPEKICQTSFGCEYAFTRNWAFAFDLVGVFNSTTRFSGNPGIRPNSIADDSPFGIPESNERKALIQYSLAPAIEYNWSQKLGLIAGCWLTVAGKNSSNFTSAVIALNYAD